MVVINVKRSKGQDGYPTNPKLIKAFKEHGDLSKIPHRFYFSDVVLKNLMTIKKAVLKNKAAYIKSGGGNKMTSAVIVIDGDSDSGKSTLASQVGLFFDPTMTLEKNYAWNFERLFYLLDHSYPGMLVLFDEGMIASSRTSNSQGNLMLVVALSQMRSKGIFFLFLANSVHMIEKSVPLSRANCLFHLRRIGGISGTPKFCCYDKDRMKDLVIKNAGKYSYKGVYPNTDWFTFSKYFPFDDVRYDVKKHKESKKNLDAKNKGRQNENRVRMALAKLMEYCKKEKFITKYTEFAKITGLASNTLSDYKRRHTEGDKKE